MEDADFEEMRSVGRAPQTEMWEGTAWICPGVRLEGEVVALGVHSRSEMNNLMACVHASGLMLREDGKTVWISPRVLVRVEWRRVQEASPMPGAEKSAPLKRTHAF